MPQQVTATFGTRHEAEEARARLIAGGVDAGAIRIEDPAPSRHSPGAGLFDSLTDFLAPGKGERPGGYVLTASVLPQQLDAATRALDPDRPSAPPAAGGLREHVVELVETAEELVIDKQLFVREEVVLRKAVTEHVQGISYVLRRTEAEVERIGPPADQSGRNR